MDFSQSGQWVFPIFRLNSQSVRVKKKNWPIQYRGKFNFSCNNVISVATAKIIMGDPAFACCRVSEFRLVALGGVSNQFFFSPPLPPPFFSFFLLSPAIRSSLSKRFVCIVYFAIQGYKLFLNKINHVSLWIDISWREFISKSRGKPFLLVRIIKYIISTLQIWRGA